MAACDVVDENAQNKIVKQQKTSSDENQGSPRNGLLRSETFATIPSLDGYQRSIWMVAYPPGALGKGTSHFGT